MPPALGFLGVVAHANHLCAEDREHDAEGRNHEGNKMVDMPPKLSEMLPPMSLIT